VRLVGCSERGVDLQRLESTGRERASVRVHHPAEEGSARRRRGSGRGVAGSKSPGRRLESGRTSSMSNLVLELVMASGLSFSFG